MSLYLTDLFFSVPETLRYVLIFVSSFFEGIPIIGAMLPGGTIALLVGSLSAEAFVHPLLAVLFIALGTFIGDMCGFMIGRRYRSHRWMKRIVEHEKHQKSWDLFDRHVALVIIFGKLLPVIRSMPSLFAAARGVVIRRYVVYSALGSVLWAFAGVYAGAFLTRVLGGATIPIILGILILSGIVALVRSKIKSKKQ
jgi:membrane protein DedA with SNARE-associated domain